MSETIAINNPIIDMITHISYSQRVAKSFGENTNTIENQDRILARNINKRTEFLEYNLEKMIDLPKLPNFNRIEATATALYLDKIRETFSTLEKDDLREILNVLEVLRK